MYNMKEQYCHFVSRKTLLKQRHVCKWCVIRNGTFVKGALDTNVRLFINSASVAMVQVMLHR